MPAAHSVARPEPEAQWSFVIARSHICDAMKTREGGGMYIRLQFLASSVLVYTIPWGGAQLQGVWARKGSWGMQASRSLGKRLYSWIFFIIMCSTRDGTKSFVHAS